ncbi:doublecortin domain-containing protein 2 [Trichonephila clavipes]|nr:doublecortin domain-containing protein 2 [Trichonephila clavipes]
MSNEITELNESSPTKNSALDPRNRRSCHVRRNDNSNNVMNLPETKWVQIHINGDEHFSGCRCVVNNRYYRNLDMFLSYLTERLQPSFGAIRQLYTPVNGHPVLNLDDLVSRQRYVVAGNERFKKLDFGYSDIGGKRNKRSRLKVKSKFKVTKAKPQCHNALFIYRRHGEVVLEVRRLQKTDILSYQQKEQAHHSSAGGKSVSCCLRKADLPKNCCQTFEGGGLYARRPVVCVPLTRQHRTARLQWCREHHNWTEQDWACVLF